MHRDRAGRERELTAICLYPETQGRGALQVGAHNKTLVFKSQQPVILTTLSMKYWLH